MKKFMNIGILLWLLCPLASAQEQEATAAASVDTVYISTSLGTMKAVFFEDTPKHTALYKRRMNDGAFDGTLFYRVVPGFMIQGGSPDSRNAAPGARVGQGSTQFLLMPEFRREHIARKGAIAAPRQPDNINPQKKSDCSQFFIVQGKKYTSGYLDTLEMARNNPIKNAWWKENYTPHKAEMDSLKTANPREYKKRYLDYRTQLDEYLHSHPKTLFFTEEDRRILTEEGGELNLNGEYTFFGEVVEGFDVIDKIAAQKTDSHERPLKDVVIRSIRVR